MAGESRSKDVGFKLFKEFEADWVFSRTLEFMNEKCAEIGECLSTARRIDQKSNESWLTEWAALAARVTAQGDESLANGHLISARESYLRASNYYRTAEYGTLPDHPRFRELWQQSVDTFRCAGELFDPPIQIVHVDFEGKQLPGYFWRAEDDDQTRPTLIAAGGNDSSLEELVYWCGMAAVRRGYNFFAFDHPGHRGAVHLYPDCIKRPDYEVPYKAALDLLTQLPGVDDRIAMTGYSLGGYVTCRVAAFEPRLKAIIPNPPIIHEPWDLRLDGVWAKLPIEWLGWLIDKRLPASPLNYAFVRYTLWSHGMPGESWLEMVDLGSYGFTVQEHLHRITCPVLALVGAGEGDAWLHQAETFMEGISSDNKRLHIFTLKEDGSNDHCQLDNRSRGNQVMFDWLDEVFDYRSASIHPTAEAAVR